MRSLVVLVGAAWSAVLIGTQVDGRAQAAAVQTAHAEEGSLFQTSNECFACHNGLTTPSGEDVSIGISWRSSMMANSGRDPYWMASVRREAIDHPTHQADIEDECSICHMPMARASAVARGRRGQIFVHLPAGGKDDEESRLAADGVSCTLCHQVGPDRLGTPQSFTGGFVLNTPVAGERHMLGPFDIDKGRTRVMQSATGFRPSEAAHVRSAELCATCHTLITTAFGKDGEPIGRLPEQVPYQEWRHSDWRQEKTCQQCHMPPVEQPTRVTSVFGEPREQLGRHTFLGGNFFMLRLLNSRRVDLAVQALPQELESSARATVRQLQSDTARVTLAGAVVAGGRLGVDVQVSNTTGHKLPTGYPARRAWLHVIIRDRSGRVVFESGGVLPNGAIQGNDGDADATKFEPHHDVIRTADEVQVYESVMGDVNGSPTTGLLTAVGFLKDNRLLPRGFDKTTAEDDIAVRGDAATDPNFTGDGDRVRYDVPVDAAGAPFDVEVELRYQPIAFRWAQNLTRYTGAEPERFVSYYNLAAAESSVVIARASTRTN